MSELYHKPLPAVPPSSTLSRASHSHDVHLTVEARAHLRRFIREALKEEGAVSNDDRESRWVICIETALDELGGSIARGGWLAGLKRARRVRKQRAEERQDQSSREQAQKDEEERAKNRSTMKSRSKLKEEVVVAPSEKHSEDDLSEDQRNQALEQLRHLVAQPFLPTPKSSLNHLLLTVAGPGSHATEPSEDLGFSLVRSAVGCTFRLGEFSLPKSATATEAEAENTVLFGLDEWDGEWSLLHRLAGPRLLFSLTTLHFR